MRRYLKRWLSAGAVLLAALSVFAPATKAFADFPGEGSRFNAESVGGQNLQTASSYSEARLTGGPLQGTLLRVWRGLSDNQVWLSFGNGNAFSIYGNFTLGTTLTFSAPTVVPLTSSSYMVLHTGTNSNIYYTVLSLNSSNGGLTWSGWAAIPNQTTNTAVSAANYNNDCGCVYVVYTGSGSDPRLYGTWYSGGVWQYGGNIAGATIYGRPDITYDPLTNALWIVGRNRNLGTTIGYTNQIVGASNWNTWSDTTVPTAQSPSIIADGNGNIMMSGASSSLVPFYYLYGPQGQYLQSENDQHGGLTTNPVTLTTYLNEIYVLLTGTDNEGFWRTLYDPD